ncbi:MAG: hypothetical protein HY736_16195, partial [Verrucomicrobia bacterium]|nr:hypothetical protein [Verrucomicrobiota bacterium]
MCRNLDTDHSPLLDIYRSVRETPGVKHAFVTSGLRYDLFLHQHAAPEAKKSHERYVDELVEHHVSGRLKVAPEHTSDDVLRVMRKPSFSYFCQFKKKFDAAKKKFGKMQLQIIPYFISSPARFCAGSAARLDTDDVQRGQHPSGFVIVVNRDPRALGTDKCMIGMRHMEVLPAGGHHGERHERR